MIVSDDFAHLGGQTLVGLRGEFGLIDPDLPPFEPIVATSALLAHRVPFARSCLDYRMALAPPGESAHDPRIP